MKIIKRCKIQKFSSYLAELEALKKLDHPNIIVLHEIIDDPNEPNIYLVMDLLPGGNIEDILKKE
jgi:serine/threonine protein kinase